MIGKIKMVIFDLDGTLADTLPLCIKAFKAAIEPLTGTALSDKEIIDTFGPSEEGTIHALVSEQLCDQALADYYKKYTELHDMVLDCFPGIKNLFNFLKDRGILITMVTGKGRKSALITLEKLQIIQYFADIETGSPDGPNKAEGIKNILNKYNITSEEAIYVGDAPSDIVASRQNNVKVCSAAWASTAEKEALEVLQPDWLFSSVSELTLLLQEHFSKDLSHNFLNLLKQINAISDIGLVYSKDDYNIERYSELKELTCKALSSMTGRSIEVIKNFYGVPIDYPTPKVDVRALILNEKKEVLLVQEQADKCWTLPGGWADIGLTPTENVIKEIHEEIGREAKVEKLIAVFDKKNHPHPPQPFYVYKMVFLCSLTDSLEKFTPAFDTLDVNYFALDSLPPLSEDRILKSQILQLFEIIEDPNHAPFCD